MATHTTYIPRPHTSSAIVVTILRFVGGLIAIATVGMTANNWGNAPDNEILLYFHLTFVLLGLGVGLGLIGLAEIIYGNTKVDDSVRRGLYERISETEAQEQKSVVFDEI
jgi:hypothetical protein